jgi:hypothetical protein
VCALFNSFNLKHWSLPLTSSPRRRARGCVSSISRCRKRRSSRCLSPSPKRRRTTAQTEVVWVERAEKTSSAALRAYACACARTKWCLLLALFAAHFDGKMLRIVGNREYSLLDFLFCRSFIYSHSSLFNSFARASFSFRFHFILQLHHVCYFCLRSNLIYSRLELYFTRSFLSFAVFCPFDITMKYGVLFVTCASTFQYHDILRLALLVALVCWSGCFLFHVLVSHHCVIFIYKYSLGLCMVSEQNFRCGKTCHSIQSGGWLIAYAACVMGKTK